MVTEIGSSRYPPPFDEDDMPSRRGIANLRLDTFQNGSHGGLSAPRGLPSHPRSPNHCPAPQLLHTTDHESSTSLPRSLRIGHKREQKAERLPPTSPISPQRSQDPQSPWQQYSNDDYSYGFPPRRSSPIRHVPRTSRSTPKLNATRLDGVPCYLASARFPLTSASDLRSPDTLRSSLNSAITSASSIDLASGTERSSILTKNSSLTDLSPDTPDAKSEDEGGMTVEDAISMYLEGFSDVPGGFSSPHSDKLQTPDHVDSAESTEDETQKSDECVQCLKSPSDNLSPIASLSDVSSVSSTVGRTHEEIRVFIPGVVPPAFLPGDGTHDCYGFRKATHHITLEQYESWSTQYAIFAASRKEKWCELLRDSGLPTVEPITFPRKSARIKRFIRKGIPYEYRGAAWFWYAGGHDLLKFNLGLYDKLVQRAMESPKNDDKEHIERDLHRTFPDNIHFKPDLKQSDQANSLSGIPESVPVLVETQMIQSLRRVLYAFALHNPNVGYTQSLNFIAGMLLLFMPEEKAFWMLHIITSMYLPGTHEISLEGANIDLWILMSLLRECLPHLYTKIVAPGQQSSRAKPPPMDLDSRLPDITLGLTNWLMSIFIGSLPLETTLRVWDVFFYEGSKTFFRVSLAIFKACEQDILRISDPMEIFQVVQTAPKKLLDANTLLEEAFARRNRFGQGRIDELRKSRRMAVRQDRARHSLGVGKSAPSPATDERSHGLRPVTPNLERGIANRWRHVKRTFN